MPGEKEGGEPSEKGGYDPNKKYKDFKWQNTDDFKNGPLGDDKRQCRDYICCLIFVAFIVGCVIVCIMGVKDGDPNLILYPYDEDGYQCGRGALKDYKFLYFYDVVGNLKRLNVSSIVNGICVKKCPDNKNPKKGEKIFLDCKPTENNPDCNVSAVSYYNSTGSKNIILFFSYG